MKNNFEVIVGLEIHVELNTKTKMFCRCPNDPFGVSPNLNICPVCSGLPGTLPVPNKEAVRKSIIVGKALGSTISEHSKWDRKHYFYPDLPKGYQISQFDLPLCVGGHIDLMNEKMAVEATLRFERVHLEEDAGKLIHGKTAGMTNVDLNRAGVPLIEMVSMPDIRSAEQARRYMQELRLLMRTLGVSDADMEKGQMRCDVNINIAFEVDGKVVKTPITEVKNVNSTRAVERSITVEAQRQYDEWQSGGAIRKRINKITVGWDEDKQTINMQRAKEAANDYRYFPEPDIPPIAVYEVEGLKPDSIELPELPNAKRVRYFGYGIGVSDIETLLADSEREARLERMLAEDADQKEAKLYANWLINAVECQELSDIALKVLIEIVQSGGASFAQVKGKMKEIVQVIASESEENEIDMRKILKSIDLLQEYDETAVREAMQAVLAENSSVVDQYKFGNQKVFGFLVGQIMKKAAGKAQPQKVQEMLKTELE